VAFFIINPAIVFQFSFIGVAHLYSLFLTQLFISLKMQNICMRFIQPRRGWYGFIFSRWLHQRLLILKPGGLLQVFKKYAHH
jgi:hypothetical protein